MLIVAHQYWPEPGPASQRLGALAKALMDAGWGVDVVTSSPAQTPGLAASTGPHGERIRHSPKSDAKGASPRRAFELLRFALAVVRLSKGRTYSAVVTDPPPTAAWAASRVARNTSADFVYFLCDTWSGATKDSSSMLSKLAHGPVKWLEDRLLANSRLTVAVTEGLREIAADAGADNILLAPNGADLSIYTREGEQWSSAAVPRPYFLYAGNAGVLQGAEVFVDAAELLWSEGRDFGLVFMGSGADMAHIRERVAPHKGRLVVLEPQPVAVVAAALRGAAASLVSLRPYPSSVHARPTKAMVALSAGCPIVYAGEGSFAAELAAADVGFVSDWSTDGVRKSMAAALELDEGPGDQRDRHREAAAMYARATFDQMAQARNIATAIVQLR
ncbi:MAG: glycosyltransferase [Salinibacterium sp.]|nr:glycosyltransferase [Salinibacterium sp.]